jgi:branched-chain amino acid transport system ATP-binding protein
MSTVQHVHRVLDVADRVYVLGQGKLQYAGTATEAKQNPATIEAHYLGGADESGLIG